MDSRIILTQADFSANNIGRYVEISDFTKKVLAKQTQYGEDDNEAVALNTFLAGCESNGFIGGDNPKFKLLVIPALASTHDELFYNIALMDGTGYPTNEMAVSELGNTTDPVLQILADNGYNIGVNFGYNSNSNTFVERTTVLNRLGLSSSEAFKPTTCFVYNLLDYTSYTTSPNILRIGNITNSRNLNIKSDKFILNNGNNGLFGFDVTSASLKGFNSLSINGTNIEATAENATLTATSDGSTMPSAVNGPASDAEKLYLSQNSSDSLKQGKLAMFGTSEYLTPTEVTTFKTLVDSLMTALHVKAYIS